MFEKEFEKIFDLAKKKDINKFDLILTNEKSVSIKVFRQEIENFSSSNQAGIGIRIIKGKQIGYAYTENFSNKEFERILDEALENSEVVEEEKEVELKNYRDIEEEIKIYYPELEEVSVQDKKDVALQMESIPMAFDKRIAAVPYAMYGDTTKFVKIANSEGLDKEYKSNAAYAFSYCLARGENMNKSGNYFEIVHNFTDINTKRIGEKASQKALNLLGAKNVESGQYPIIFHHNEAATMLQTFASIFSAKKVQEGQSLLKGKLDSNIANNNISIIDDALYKSGFSTRPFDAEGYPSQTTNLIKDGVLSSYIHNTQTAQKAGVKSTGNATRSYKSAVEVSSTNMFFAKGNKKKSELYKMFPKSIEIVSLAGMHSGCNPISGDFSLSAEGFVCNEDGRDYPVHNFTISGNFLQMLKNINAVADDLKFNMQNFGSPSVLVESLSISG